MLATQSTSFAEKRELLNGSCRRAQTEEVHTIRGTIANNSLTTHFHSKDGVDVIIGITKKNV